MARVLVTGGAGYIGTHVLIALHDAGHDPVAFDNLTNGHPEVVRSLGVPLVRGDVLDRPALDQVFRSQPFDAVVHLAGFLAAGESVVDPGKYYRNNVVGSLVLLEAMVTHDVRRLIFSSSAAVYGAAERVPIPETSPEQPVQPYGASKAMVERLIQDFAVAHGLLGISLRYFNAAGADPQTRAGEDHFPETHLIPLAIETALGRRSAIEIHGTDYATPDGTCVRDYVHVSDLARAHCLALEPLLHDRAIGAVNLGTGRGSSVREVIDTCASVTGRAIPTTTGPRRPGDVSSLVCASDKARSQLGWTPQYPELKTIVEHAWHWHQNRHGAQRTSA